MSNENEMWEVMLDIPKDHTSAAGFITAVEYLDAISEQVHFFDEEIGEDIASEMLRIVLGCIKINQVSPYKMFYFTFGLGQTNAGKCQPIRAKNMIEARGYMVQLHGTNWAFSYDEEDWTNAKKRAQEKGYDIEEELPTLIVEELEDGDSNA